MSEELEPFCITNPTRKYYKFLFRSALDDETIILGEQFCKKWLEERGWTIKRQKIVDIRNSFMFQIRVWLN